MIAQGPDDGGPPPEILAAYVDGELNASQSAQVEAWLAAHPDAAAEVESLRGLAQLFQSAAPAEPNEEQWAGVFGKIKAGLIAVESTRPSPWHRFAWGAMGVACTAAVVAVAFFLTQPGPTHRVPDPEPYPVVGIDDVEIISLHASDVRALVVGEPPVREPLTLLAHGEVIVDQVKSEVEGMDPRYFRDTAYAPMIIMMPKEEEP